MRPGTTFDICKPIQLNDLAPGPVVKGSDGKSNPRPGFITIDKDDDYKVKIDQNMFDGTVANYYIEIADLMR